MTIDERIEALTMNMELCREITKILISVLQHCSLLWTRIPIEFMRCSLLWSKTLRTFARLLGEAHEHRLTDLEGGEA